MQRYFLAKGDRAGAAVIVEGLPTSTYQGADGVRVELSYAVINSRLSEW